MNTDWFLFNLIVKELYLYRWHAGHLHFFQYFINFVCVDVAESESQEVRYDHS